MSSESEVLAQAEAIEECLRHIHRRMRSTLADDMRRSPLTRPQLQALEILVHSGTMSLKALSRHMALAHSTVSGIVDRLERHGYVRRELDSRDRRGVRIMTSEPVEAYLRDILPVHRLGPLLEALRSAHEDQRRRALEGVTLLHRLLEARSDEEQGAPGIESREATREYPILEFDEAREALLEPAKLIRPKGIPEHAIACFFADVIEGLAQRGEARVVAHLKSEIGRNPIYEIEVDGRWLAVFHPGVGAPLAAGFLEEMIALGGRKFIACGGAGVLASTIAVGHPIVVSAAVRDEGTSYHYLPPAREVAADSRGVAALEATLGAANVEYLVGKTWTTDAIYRETPGKIKRRREEGCVAVEMEAAAFFAVARFRSVPFGQLLYAGDDVGGETWDSRRWDRHSSVRERLFWLSAEACLRL